MVCAERDPMIRSTTGSLARKLNEEAWQGDVDLPEVQWCDEPKEVLPKIMVEQVDSKVLVFPLKIVPKLHMSKPPQMVELKAPPQLLDLDHILPVTFETSSPICFAPYTYLKSAVLSEGQYGDARTNGDRPICWLHQWQQGQLNNGNWPDLYRPTHPTNDPCPTLFITSCVLFWHILSLLHLKPARFVQVLCIWCRYEDIHKWWKVRSQRVQKVLEQIRWKACPWCNFLTEISLQEELLDDISNPGNWLHDASRS